MFIPIHGRIGGGVNVPAGNSFRAFSPTIAAHVMRVRGLLLYLCKQTGGTDPEEMQIHFRAFQRMPADATEFGNGRPLIVSSAAVAAKVTIQLGSYWFPLMFVNVGNEPLLGLQLTSEEGAVDTTGSYWWDVEIDEEGGGTDGQRKRRGGPPRPGGLASPSLGLGSL